MNLKRKTKPETVFILYSDHYSVHVSYPRIKLVRQGKVLEEKMLCETGEEFEETLIRVSAFPRVQTDLWTWGIKFNLVKLVSHLIENFTLPDNGEQRACIYGHIEILKLFLPLYEGHLGTLLMMGVQYGHLKVVKWLVENGADIHYGDDNALRIAYSDNKLPILKYLIAQGAYAYVLKGRETNGSNVTVRYVEMLEREGKLE